LTAAAAAGPGSSRPTTLPDCRQLFVVFGRGSDRPTP